MIMIININIIIIIFTQLAEVITEESNLREENRRMSIMIAEAEEVCTFFFYDIMIYIRNIISGFDGLERRKG